MSNSLGFTLLFLVRHKWSLPNVVAEKTLLATKLAFFYYLRRILLDKLRMLQVSHTMF